MAHYGLSRRLVGLSNLCEAYNLGALRIRIEPWGILQVKKKERQGIKESCCSISGLAEPCACAENFREFGRKHVELQVTAWGVELRAF